MRKSIQSILNFNNSSIGQERLKVIEFQEKYGDKATIDVYGISKTTIYTAGKRDLKTIKIILRV